MCKGTTVGREMIVGFHQAMRVAKASGAYPARSEGRIKEGVCADRVPTEDVAPPACHPLVIGCIVKLTQGGIRVFDPAGRLVDKDIARAWATGIAAIGEATQATTRYVIALMGYGASDIVDIVDTAAMVDAMARPAQEAAMADTMGSFGASAQIILKLVGERRRRTHTGCPPRLAATPLRRREILLRPVVAHRVSPRRNRAQSRPGGKTAARRAA